MKTAVLVFFTLLGLAMTGPGHAARDTLRCGGKIITIGMLMDEVLKFCGKPQSKETEEIPVHSGNRITGTTFRHVLTYPRSGGKPAVLTFDRDKLVSIEYP